MLRRIMQSYRMPRPADNYAWLVLVVCLLGFATQLTAQEKAASKNDLPDIIYLISDDQAWNDYSFMGHEQIQTPNIDSLAKESLLFTRGYVPDSLCRPSLATMISGLYPHQTGIVGNDPPSSTGSKGVRGGRYRDKEYQQDIEEYLKLHIDRIETLPDRLKPLGYVSFQTGKWWEGNPARGGFDEGMTHGDHNRGARHGDVGLDIGRKGMEPIEKFVKQSRSAGKPYFLWYAPMLPHTPHTPPDDLLAKYKKLTDSEPIAKYWAMCEYFDQTVGELRDIVNKEGRPNNTLIVYVCDNGWINLPDQSAYAPKSKRSQYDGGIRTPIFFHWPGHIAAKRDDVNLASSIDLVPTVLSLVGVEPTQELPGINLSDSKQVAARDTLTGEILEHDIQEMDNPRSSLMYRWIIKGHMKTIIPELSRVHDGVPEYYDLSKDPWEEHNLAAEHPMEVKRMTEALDAWWK